MHCLLIVAAGCVALAASADAQNPGQSPSCRNGFAPDPSIELMEVAGRDKAFFRRDYPRPACPADESCKHGYVLPGQQVLVSGTMGEFVCAYFVESRTLGWMAKSQLTPVPQGKVGYALQDWTGAWINNKNEDSRIDITLDGARLVAKGMSYWPGRLYKQTPGMPSMHTGGFDLKGEPKDDMLSLSDEFGICRVSLRRLGDYLIVADNRECGGLNVSFSDFYVRSK